MNNKFKYFITGTITGIIIASCGVVLASNTTIIEAVYNNIKIVVDGKEFTPKDPQGNIVEPFISNGTTYLPVRAVANATGKEVYWDGNNYTVYLGNMNGELKYPTAYLKDLNNIGNKLSNVENDSLIDNYGNTYSSAVSGAQKETFQTLLNGRYTKFKGTLYIPQYYIVDKAISIIIEADGHQIYASPQMTKTSPPIDLDINVTGYNDFKIIFNGNYSSGYNRETQMLCLANAGFYQW